MTIGNPIKTAEIVNNTMQWQEKFYQEFLNEGLNFARGYLSSFGNFRRFLAENYMLKESARYYGAKRALEELTKED